MVASRVALGVVGLLFWLGLFGSGALIDSKPYRDALRGRPDSAVPVAATASLTPAVNPTPPIHSKDLFLAILLFTPLNAALLTLSAGLIGGCASNITFSRQASAESAAPPEREAFRSENPLASMLRSFLVYLAFIAGVYITTNEPFENPTPEQYVRLAGTLSFFAFVVGYDPTKFRDFLNFGKHGS